MGRKKKRQNSYIQNSPPNSESLSEIKGSLTMTGKDIDSAEENELTENNLEDTLKLQQIGTVDMKIEDFEDIFESQQNEIVNMNIGDFDLLKSTLDSYDLMNESQKGIVLKNIEISCKRAQLSSKIAVSMFEEVKKKKKLLKIIDAAVPEGILPPGYSCALYDVRIALHGPDEKTYRENKWIRENVTRGLNFMQLTGKEKKFDFAIYANKKFTGGVGDEDDYQPETNDIWEEFCLDSPLNATEVICMTKLNGEAGHFTVRKIGGEYFIIAGSKNVHMMFKTYSDIEKYSDSRYMVAKTVSTAVLDTFNEMEESKLNILKHYLDVTKTTVVCELLQPHYQHIIDLSYLKKSTIYGLMMTSVPGKEEDDSLTTIPPHICLEYFKFFGISIPEYYSIPVKDVRENITKMRRAKNSEGYVLYYLIKDRTIGLAKVKTIWYVVVRALREKVDYTFNCKKMVKPLSERISATKTRLNQIQKWLGFCNDCLAKWKDLGEAFFYYLDSEIKANRICPKNIRPKFPAVWKGFMKNYKKSVDFCCCEVT